MDRAGQTIGVARFSYIFSRRYRGDHLWTGVLSAIILGIVFAATKLPQQSPVSSILATLNLSLLILSLGWWVSLLWKRLTTHVVIIALFLTLYWLVRSPVVTLISSTAVSSELNLQLLTTVFSLGLIGAVSALWELSKSRSSKLNPNYLSLFNRSSAFPSFSGMGSLIITGVIRLVRDRLFIVTFAVLILCILGGIEIGSLFGTAQLTVIGLAALSLIVVRRLSSLTSSLAQKLAGLPTSPAAIGFAFNLSGLAITVAIGWIILSGLMRIDFGTTIELTGIILTGQIGAIILGRLTVRDQTGMQATWLLTAQILAVVAIYQTLWSVTGLGIATAFLVGLFCLFASNSFETQERSATI